jgi:Zn-dependent protease with chaperone function
MKHGKDIITSIFTSYHYYRAINFLFLSILFFALLLTACSINHPSTNSKDLFIIGKKQYDYIRANYQLWDNSYHVVRLMEIHARLCNKSNNCPHLRYYVLAIDTPVVFTSIDGRLFIAYTLLDHSSKYFCTDEELSAILAHEIAHLEHCHLLQHIEHQKSFRFPDIEIQEPNAEGVMATAAILATGPLFHPDAKTLNEMNMNTYLAYDLQRQNNDNFRIWQEIAKDLTLYSNYGFNLEHEFEADKRACELLKKVGIKPSALIDILNKQLLFIKTAERFDARNTYIENYESRINKISNQ